MLPPKTLLFLIILLEGYVVLAAELLAMRLLIPHAGSGVEIIAIVISGVLLPLAAGYHVGGMRYQRSKAQFHEKGGRFLTIRKLLLRNLITAMIMLVMGLSYVFLELWFHLLQTLGIEHPLVQAAVYVGVFLVTPVFLLAQTVPLVSNYFSRRELSQITGRMLFFSTIGSFFGSVVSTIIFMNWLGVHLTAVLTLGMLALAVLLLTRRWYALENAIVLLFLGIMFAFNNDALMRDLDIVSANAYSTVTVKDVKGRNAKDLYLNHSWSSRYAEKPEDRFSYVRFLEDEVISTLPKNAKILIIGAGGFTMGWDDLDRHYVFVDIDPQLKDVSEQYLLPHELPANKEFVVQSARSFLGRNKDTYDLIVADAYSNKISIPLEVTTREYWQAIREHLKPGGVVAANMILSPRFDDRYSVRMSNTFTAVFPHHLRQLLHGEGERGTAMKSDNVNLLYIYYDVALERDDAVYTDDRTTYSIDKHIK